MTTLTPTVSAHDLRLSIEAKKAHLLAVLDEDREDKAAKFREAMRLSRAIDADRDALAEMEGR